MRKLPYAREAAFGFARFFLHLLCVRMDLDGFIQKEIAGNQGEDASQSEQRYPKHKHKCNGMKQTPMSFRSSSLAMRNTAVTSSTDATAVRNRLTSLYAP